MKKVKLLPETERKLLDVLFYSPNVSTTSVKELYSKVKNRGITLDQVKNYVQNQEVTQLFKRTKRIHKYFPITANYRDEILQCDLVDLSNLQSSNSHYSSLLVCIDIFSRYTWVIPMKNKTKETVCESMKKH